MSVFISDDFSGTSGQQLTAYLNAWTLVSGTPNDVCISNAQRLRGAATGTRVYQRSNVPDSPDYHVSADFVYVGVADSVHGIAGRIVGTTTYYFVRFESNNQVVKLYSLVSGTATVLGESSQSLAVGQTLRLTLEMIGTAIKVYRDGVEIISVTNSAISGTGLVGVRMGSNATQTDSVGVHLDNLVAANGAFIVSATPVGFTGTVPTLNGAEGVSFSESVASYFSGTETPFSYAVHSGALPAGLSLNSSTGVISGTPTTAGTSSGIVIRATDDDSNTADTNAFSIVIAAAEVDPPADAPTSVSAVAQSSSHITLTWAGVTGATGYEVEIDSGTPIDVGNVLVYQHTGLAPDTEYSYRVRGYNDNGAGPWSSAVQEFTDALPTLGWTTAPAVESVTTTSITITAEPNQPCNVFAVALRKGRATPTGANVIEGEDGDQIAAAASASVSFTGGTAELTLLPLTEDPIYDVYVVAHIPA